MIARMEPPISARRGRRRWSGDSVVTWLGAAALLSGGINGMIAIAAIAVLPEGPSMSRLRTIVEGPDAAFQAWAGSVFFGVCALFGLVGLWCLWDLRNAGAEANAPLPGEIEDAVTPATATAPPVLAPARSK
jgi:hypothetical protein